MQHGGGGGLVIGDAGAHHGHESQMYADAWGRVGDNDSESEGENGSSSAKIDRSLALEVNIPLEHRGELVSFREVRQWKVPTQMDLAKLKTRINDELMKPLNLRQQDIVKASGLGAPYVCYLLKDPNSPNMNRRRKIEAYSVLTELFRKYDTKTITKDDFIRLRNQRVANRFQGPRQDRSGRGAGLGRGQQRQRGRRRLGPYGEEEIDDDDDDIGSHLDDDLLDPATKVRRKRRAMFSEAGAPMGYFGDMSGAYGGMKPAGTPYGPQYGQMPANAGYGPYGGMVSPQPIMQQPQQYPTPQPWLASANVPFWPAHQYVYLMARGQKQNNMGEFVETPEGTPFQAPYPPGFPPVLRTIVSLANVVDAPPPVTLRNDKAGMEGQEELGGEDEKAHDAWIRTKVSELARPVVVPKSENGSVPVFREPNTHAFVFLVDRSSCLLPIGVKIASGAAPATLDDIWDIRNLRHDAEQQDWLDENRDWDDSLWVLWDLRESGTAVQALFEKWKHEHNLTDDELSKVAKCFLSQYVHLRDIELSFRALLQHAPPHEDFCRNVEINCDLLEERIRVKDAFVWDIRASDWDLTALLSNFVSDFQLDSPAISSLFIDLKTTVLRHRKAWVTHMLERLTAEGKIDASRYLPSNLGLDPI